MPHKRNPVLAVLVRAAALQAPQLAAQLHLGRRDRRRRAPGRRLARRVAGAARGCWSCAVTAASQAAELARRPRGRHRRDGAPAPRAPADALLAESGGDRRRRRDHLGAAGAIADALLERHDARAAPPWLTCVTSPGSRGDRREPAAAACSGRRSAPTSRRSGARLRRRLGGRGRGRRLGPARPRPQPGRDRGVHRGRPRRRRPCAGPPSWPPAGRTTYAGVSVGGAVGLQLAARRPGRSRRVAALASAPRLGEPERWAERAELVRRGRARRPWSTGSAGRWFAPGFLERDPATGNGCCCGCARPTTSPTRWPARRWPATTRGRCSARSPLPVTGRRRRARRRRTPPTLAAAAADGRRRRPARGDGRRRPPAARRGARTRPPPC